MDHQPMTKRAREIVRTLTPLIAEHAQAESSRSAALKQQTQAAEREYKQAVQERESRLVALRKAADEERLALIDEIRGKHERRMAEAREQMEAEISAFVDTTNKLESRADQKLEDSRWLAETLVESAEGKAKTEFDAADKERRTRAGELEQILRDSGELLARAGHAPLAGEAFTGDAASLPSPQVAVREASESAAVLRSRVKPAVLRPSAIIIVAFVMGLGGALSMAASSGFEPRNFALGGGGGVAASLVIMLVLRLALRRRVPAASAALSQKAARVRASLDALMERASQSRDAILADAIRRRDAELEKGQGRFRSARAEIDRRRMEEEPALRAKHQSTLMDITTRTSKRTEEVDEKNRARLRQVEQEHAAALADLARVRDAKIAEATGEAERAGKAESQRFLAEASSIREKAAELAREDRELSPPWSTLDTGSFVPRAAVPTAVRFGVLSVDASQMPGGLPADEELRAAVPARLDVPAMLDFLGTGSLLIQTGPEGRAQAVAALQNTMLRILTTFPPAKAKFTIVDPVGLGQSFAGFMHLADHDESLVSDRIWTDPRHIEQKLTDLTEHMEAVIQKYLRNEFRSIQEYNEKAGEVAEPFRFLVIADFPANFTETAARRLASIVASGPRCGVFTLIATDTRQRPPAWIPMADLEQASVCLTHRDGRLWWKDADFGAWPLELDMPPGDDVVTALAHAVGVRAKEAGRVQVPFAVVAPDDAGVWTQDASVELRVPLGRAGATKLQSLTLGRGTSQHVLIAGRTGSGKSTLLHALITNLALWYSPSEVEFYLVDFKKGVEFKTYATHRLPHARVVAVESEREFGLSVMRRLDAELTRRGTMFRDAGVQDLASFRKHSGKPLPRVLLIVDEFQEFFTEDDKLAQEAMLLMDRLVRQGRAFGMHVILGSQTIGGAYSLARSTIGQMAVRIALQCSEADSYLILSEDNAAARLLSRPGEAIYNDQSGMIEGNSPFQVVWLPDDVRDTRLSSVVRRSAERGVDVPPTIVFEGNVPSRLDQNAAMNAIRDGLAPAPSMPMVWLGEAISIKDPTSVRFRRQSGGNLLIVGQQEHSSLGVVCAAGAAVIAQCPPDAGARLHILDGGSPDSETADALRELASNSQGRASVTGPRGADAVVATLHEEMLRRSSDPAGEAPPIFLLVSGLQRFRSLRKSEEDFGFSGDDAAAEKPDKQFAALLREGPTQGIFVIVRVDTLTNLERALDRRLLKEFDHRVLFQMSANDSSGLIEGTQAANLGQHRGLLYSEETGQVEKFRPYAPSDAAATP